jgi:hypothetical protein
MEHRTAPYSGLGQHTESHRYIDLEACPWGAFIALFMIPSTMTLRIFGSARLWLNSRNNLIVDIKLAYRLPWYSIYLIFFQIVESSKFVAGVDSVLSTLRLVRSIGPPPYFHDLRLYVHPCFLRPLPSPDCRCHTTSLSALVVVILLHDACQSVTCVLICGFPEFALSAVRPTITHLR